MNTEEILAVIREHADITNSVHDVDVNEVDEPTSTPVPDSPAKTTKRASMLDGLRAEMLAAGCDPTKVDGLIAVRVITGSRQRITPVWTTVCAPETVAFWSTRTDEQIESDIPKLQRRDGGTLGPVSLYSRIIAGAPSPQAAAGQINEHAGRRIASMRLYSTMAINEIRRRRAVAAGLDPKAIKYLRVTEVPEVATPAEVVGENDVDGDSEVNGDQNDDDEVDDSEIDDDEVDDLVKSIAGDEEVAS